MASNAHGLVEPIARSATIVDLHQHGAPGSVADLSILLICDQSIVDADGSVGILPMKGFETRDRASGLFSPFEEDQFVEDREEESIAPLENQQFGVSAAASQVTVAGCGISILC
jgi:hypothetical protein